MNIFFLELDLKECARSYGDKHVVKLILEITQMLWTAYWICAPRKIPHSGVKVYRATHVNHPMCIWVRTSPNNFRYASKLGLELCKEYTRRYYKTHKCQETLEWLNKHIPSECVSEPSSKAYFATQSIPFGCTPVPLCMPEKYHHPNLITAYRNYYREEKREIAKWKYTQEPSWFQ